MNSLSEFFPPHLIAMSGCLHLKLVIPATLSNYTTGLFHFSQFCNNYRSPKAFHIPVSEALLTMFITCCNTTSVSASTMKHWLLGLELWHETSLKELDIMGMGIGHWDQLDEISLAWLLGLQLRRYNPK